jgi:hypothetical protein
MIKVQVKGKNPVFDGVLLGVPEGIRTPGLLIRSQTLYPAELQVHLGAAVQLNLAVRYIWRRGRDLNSRYLSIRGLSRTVV